MRKKSKLKRLFSKRVSRGFTLVEVVISTVLLGILVVGVVAFSTPILQMVGKQEDNARAAILAESINTYIDGNLRYAKKVAIVDNITSADAMTSSGSANAIIQSHDGLKELLNTNVESEEIRCFGFCWGYDNRNNDLQKLYLVNYTVKRSNPAGYNEGFYIEKVQDDKDGSAAFNDSCVFDKALYEGLFPVVSVVPLLPGGDDTKAAGVYMVTSDIRTNENCYDPNNKVIRDNAALGFKGVTYIKTNILNAEDMYENKHQTVLSDTDVGAHLPSLVFYSVNKEATTA